MKNRPTYQFQAYLFAASLLVSPLGWSAQMALAAKVNAILVDSGNYGGCMADLSVSPTTVLPECAANWVTFSCTGDFNSEVIGYQKLDSAKLAFVSGKSLYLQIDDQKKHNGYCFAQRVDVR